MTGNSLILSNTHTHVFRNCIMLFIYPCFFFLEFSRKHFPALFDMIRYYGADQIRNTAVKVFLFSLFLIVFVEKNEMLLPTNSDKSCDVLYSE